MRDIKFRVFHQREKKMYSVKVLEMFNEGDWRVTIVGFTDKLGMYITSDRGQLMQYTGLKDKNGKEIYEGDIVFNPHDENERYVIEWYSTDACFELGENGQHISKYQLSEFWEVIGNIYENPELLVGARV